MLRRLFWISVFCLLPIASHGSPSASSSREYNKSEVFFLSSKIKKRQQLGCVSSGKKNTLLQILGADSNTVLGQVLKRTKSNFKKYQKGQKECSKLKAFPECKDKRDNDGDGERDFPADTDCESAEDSSEQGNIGALQVFRKPFASDFSLASLFDHQFPLEFIHEDDVVISSYGQSTTDAIGVDGHQGYDFLMDEGIEVLASADGEVIFAGLETPYLCPLLGQTVAGNTVVIKHSIAGQFFASVYAHFSSISVSVGQTVTKGQLLGLSGNTGCSTGPHLHFDIQRLANESDFSGPSIDPFGWNASFTDPWSQHASGTTSELLWEPGQAPSEYRYFSIAPNPNAGDNGPVAITAFRWAGWDDSQNPNNEYIELTLDTRYSNGNSYDLSGFTLQNFSGESYSFLNGFKIKAGAPVRLYSGKGTNSAQVLYWNRSSPAWSNDGDCAKLLHSNGSLFYFLFYGIEACLNPSALNNRQSSGGKVSYPRD